MQSRQHMQSGTANKTHLQASQGDTRGGRGGWVDPGDETAGRSAQDMSEQGSTGDRRRVDQPERVAGGVGRLHEDLRRRNLGTTASFRNWLDLVSSHAMIKVLGGLWSSNEQGGHTYFGVFLLPGPVAVLCVAGNSAWRREEACRRRCCTRSGEVA